MPLKVIRMNLIWIFVFEVFENISSSVSGCHWTSLAIYLRWFLIFFFENRFALWTLPWIKSPLQLLNLKIRTFYVVSLIPISTKWIENVWRRRCCVGRWQWLGHVQGWIRPGRRSPCCLLVHRWTFSMRGSKKFALNEIFIHLQNHELRIKLMNGAFKYFENVWNN